MKLRIYFYIIAALLLKASVQGQPPSGLPVYNSNTPVNFIRTWTATAPVSTANNLMQGNLLQVKEATEYFDGLGRPLQTVIKKGALSTNSPNDNTGSDTSGAKDLVTPVLYDEFGRERYKFLPFASSSANGQFKTTPYTEHTTFMNSQYGSQGNDKNYGYSQTVFEASPLNRVLEQFAPGESWAGSAIQSTEPNRHSIKTKYWVNTSTDGVRIWNVTNGQPGSGSSSVQAHLVVNSRNPSLSQYTATNSITFTNGFQSQPGDNFTASIVSSDPLTSLITTTYASTAAYQPGTLYKNVTADEHGKQVIEFKDKAGQLVLKKVQLTAAADTSGGSDHDGWMCTYYIYDDFNNLRCVIQPEGVQALSQPAVNWQLSPVILNEQCFRYEYDGRNRMIVKKVPGAAEVVMVYDVRDRLVMTQDGNLRSQYSGIWNYTLYDGLNRPVQTGLIQPSSNTPGDHWSAAMALSGTTNAAIQYPTPAMLTTPTVLTETFYDMYDWVDNPSYFISNPSAFKGFDGLHNDYLLTFSNTTFPYAQQPAKDSRTKGMVTDTRVKVLNDPNNRYIFTLTLYDDKARPVQVKTINHAAGVDIATTQYSWSGQPLVTVSRQQKADVGSAIITTVTKNTYDALERITQTTKNVINNNSSVQSGDKIIAQNLYDALGQLKAKKLGVTGSTPVETQNYDYNIRGWLLGMNRGYVNNSLSVYNFGYDLAYDKAINLSGLPGYTKGLYNGNISGMTWRGKTGSAEIRRYNYDYDAANRLLKADFGQYNGSGFSATAVDFSMKMGDGATASTAYDLNGNILKMWQKGLVSGTSQIIDNLTYTYNSGSNKLAKVTDAAAPTTGLGDFNNGTNGGDDYTYDFNGNLTKDENKNISSITYNVLNLPEQITVTGKGTITYRYDAAGNKLQKKIVEGSNQKITDYIGSLIFENNVLQHVATEEGRARLETGVWKFDYFLKDHLGNVRAMVADNGTVLEETHYYPFGLIQKGISTRQTGNLHNKEKTFQDQQIDEDLDLNWVQFKYRNHDPQIGRFIEIDPLSDKYVHNSTYAFSENKVTAHVELEGLESFSIQDLWRSSGITNSTDPKQFVKDVGKEVLKPQNWVEAGSVVGQIGGTVLATEFFTGGMGGMSIVNTEVSSFRSAANATKVSEVAEVKLSPKGELPSAPNFIVDAKGTAYPVPKDAKGPVLADNTKGIKYIEGKGGNNGQVSTMRVMDPTPQKGSVQGYPNGYIKYENKLGQGVNPYSGKTGSKADTHFPINNATTPKVDNTYVKKPMIIP